MADDLSTKDYPDDRARIDMSERNEVRHWTKRFGVTESDLQQAIDRVGPGVKAVAKELGKPL